MDDMMAKKTEVKSNIAQEPALDAQVTFYKVTTDNGDPTLVIREVKNKENILEAYDSVDRLGTWRTSMKLADYIRDGLAVKIDENEAKELIDKYFKLTAVEYADLLRKQLEE